MSEVIVLFEVTLQPGRSEDYLSQAASLKAVLSEATGLIRAERFSSLVAENKLLSMSVWDCEESINKWRGLMAHRMCQKHGREVDFADYQITVVSPIRAYSKEDRVQAPADSNRFWEEQDAASRS